MTAEQQETDLLLDRVCEQIAQQVFDASDRETLGRMVECFADSRGMVRLRIAETLGKIGQPALPFLMDALEKHENPVVRRASGKTITLIADPVAIPVLIRALLYDEDTVVKGSAVGALARMGEKAVPVLLEIIASEEHPQSIKGHAAWALAFMGAEVKEELYRAISDDSGEVRSAIVAAIGNLVQETKDEKGLELLLASLQDSEAMVRAEAATALSQLDESDEIISALIASLQDEDGEVRKNVSLSLMKLGDRSILDSLQTALDKETEEGTKKAIALAVSRIENKVEEEDDDW
ncbi:MAG: HEAT repeat domain-containing protein [Cyanobacteria bacterium SBLK]|nr:HEAT repeat domain-containing protein [Cyanobacteria bacterium SBLK]